MARSVADRFHADPVSPVAAALAYRDRRAPRAKAPSRYFGNLAHPDNQLAEDDAGDDAEYQNHARVLSDHGLHTDLWQQRPSSQYYLRHAGDAARGHVQLLLAAGDGC